MNSAEVRDKFLSFFDKKGHEIVSSSPIVNKDDPTLMFINAGMNPFKDIFLGNKSPAFKKVANTQKCLRVSGKHNDLEEVGHDSYHNTMFEMLGNWSFGDYFKAETIQWAWELLTEEYGLDPDRMYVTIFKGDPNDNLPLDKEASTEWKKYVTLDRIIPFGKKDNFWEMGDTGPCGPCSEIHIDLRSDEERKKIPADELVNRDDPLVIELWNLVFIEFNRLSDGTLQNLPARHVDTGMGFERLCMVIQGKKSNYAIDLFQPIISKIYNLTGKKYTGKYDPTAYSDIAYRVVADHIRAVCFTISDGQIPSNTGAGYVIRRILRRAVRYYYSYLNYKKPMLYQLTDVVADIYKEIFSNLHEQRGFVQNVVLEEERSFLKTLEKGLEKIEKLDVTNNEIAGEDIFELYDTYGFPPDLTQLIAEEKGLKVDMNGFHQELDKQKERSRTDAKQEKSDWIRVNNSKPASTEFAGYDHYQLSGIKLQRYRKTSIKGNKLFEVVVDKTPFYAEAGGQAGDTGIMRDIQGNSINILNTYKENELILHLSDSDPTVLVGEITAEINSDRRKKITANHSATHLLHAALREVLGPHVEQRGSSVEADQLRFDFSHPQRLSHTEIEKVERRVNKMILKNIKRGERREASLEKAKEEGAMMLFGEKYGDKVRVITFDPSFSVELCGGCHVLSTGEIGGFYITGESSIAAGVRRITAVTGMNAYEYHKTIRASLNKINASLGHPSDTVARIESLLEERKAYEKEINVLRSEKKGAFKETLLQNAIEIGGVPVVVDTVSVRNAKTLKSLVFEINDRLNEGIIGLGADAEGKPLLALHINKKLVELYNLNASDIIREAAREIQGGGGGQSFFATAGGKNPDGLEKALQSIRIQIEERLS